MIDPYGRTIDYLRVSVTDRCNFRCVYCMPEEGADVCAKQELLTFEEIARLVRIAVCLGITKVRLTGGEPLVRKELPKLVEMISSSGGAHDLSMTTNGFLLERFASELASTGLHRVNVSLDTLKPERFEPIARRGNLQTVLDGIAAAMKAGLRPLKLNCVAMRGVNDDEVADFARWTLSEPVHVRFIELMPIRWNLDETDGFQGSPNGLLSIRQTNGSMLSDAKMRRMSITADELRARIESELGPMEEAHVPTNGPARSYRLPGAKGTVGFISQISNDLCSRCNRLRLTSDGWLRPCLMSDGELDLKTPMRQGCSDRDLDELFLQVVRDKPERHYLAEGQKVLARGMSQLGG